MRKNEILLTHEKYCYIFYYTYMNKTVWENELKNWILFSIPVSEWPKWLFILFCFVWFWSIFKRSLKKLPFYMLMLKKIHSTSFLLTSFECIFFLCKSFVKSNNITYSLWSLRNFYRFQFLWIIVSQYRVFLLRRTFCHFSLFFVIRCCSVASLPMFVGSLS